MSNWISVKDRLPPDARTVIVHYDTNITQLANYIVGKWWHVINDPTAVPTHWQPLPEPPEST